MIDKKELADRCADIITIEARKRDLKRLLAYTSAREIYSALLDAEREMFFKINGEGNYEKARDIARRIAKTKATLGDIRRAYRGCPKQDNLPKISDWFERVRRDSVGTS